MGHRAGVAETTAPPRPAPPCIKRSLRIGIVIVQTTIELNLESYYTMLDSMLSSDMHLSTRSTRGESRSMQGQQVFVCFCFVFLCKSFGTHDVWKFDKQIVFPIDLQMNKSIILLIWSHETREHVSYEFWTISTFTMQNPYVASSVMSSSGESWRKLEKAEKAGESGESWRKLEKAGESWRKLEKAGES